jgi:small subunit ribosomal protein S16
MQMPVLHIERQRYGTACERWLVRNSFLFQEEIIMVKIRLARFGEKRVPIYRIVVQESSAPRNGKTIDSIGYYDPNTEPATIKIDAEKANEWIKKGAQPTDVVKKLMKTAAKAN